MALNLDLLLRPAVLAPTLSLLAFFIYNFFFTGIKYPNIPIIGAKKTDYFPLLQATYRNTANWIQAIETADTLYPNIPVQLMQTDFTTPGPDPYLADNPVHHHIITSTLTQQTPNFIPEIVDQIEWAFEKNWGRRKGMERTAINRVFVGKKISRNQEYLDLASGYARAVFLAAVLIRPFWRPLRPLVAPIITIPVKRITRRWNQILVPEIKQRLDEWDTTHQRRGEDAEKINWGLEERNDFLQWLIAQGKELDDPYMYKPETLAGRLTLLNFAGIHTSSIAIVLVIMDLVYGKKEYIDELREISTVLAEFDGKWCKRALAKMIKPDSTMRESQRYNSVIVVGTNRMVVAEEGIVTTSGVRIPKDCQIAVPSHVVLHDEGIYEGAGEFKPFRFVEERLDEKVEYVKRAGKAWATTSNEFLGFGQGRNACPGRFFAATEVRLVEGVGKGKPEVKWFAHATVPDLKACIRVKRREFVREGK
ncbi:ent-kaurene oxidase [Podospora fimiseda]|uniref:Ent-kaurene oxidase n=1 Tax=Podospora fimiseda TaxID=252190 RepID=A0AAN7BJ20_9PEZI|nr:ent-kaurene oxidase [Podospora fimiseda]